MLTSSLVLSRLLMMSAVCLEMSVEGRSSHRAAALAECLTVWLSTGPSRDISLCG